MKKIILTAVLAVSLMFAGMTDSVAQLRYGVIGGATFSKFNKSEIFKGENMTQYHAGLTLQLKLPLGFSIQPSLIYQVKGSKLGVQELTAAATDLSVGYLELPVSVQWGPDLLLFRPFLDVTPFVGYGLNNKVTAAGGEVTRNSWNDNGIHRWEYGLGVGVGLEIWKFQVIGRYNWNFGNLMDFTSDAQDGIAGAIVNSFEKGNFGGFTLTAAFLF